MKRQMNIKSPSARKWMAKQIAKANNRGFASQRKILSVLNMLKKELKKASSLDTIEEIEKIIETIVEDIKAIEEKNKSMYVSLKEEINKLYLQVKNAKVPEYNSLTRHEEEKIINLYKSGYNVEDISKELRIPAGEVELILKFANIV